MHKSFLALFLLLAFAAVAQEASQLSMANIAELQKKAQSGDARAQVALGHAYETGSGIAQNDELAVKWYRTAAERGDAEGQNNLGVMYRLGHGVDRDMEEAVGWYRKAAAQGFASALYNLGVAYYNGDGVPTDDTLSLAFFMLASGPAASRLPMLSSAARAKLTAHAWRPFNLKLRACCCTATVCPPTLAPLSNITNRPATTAGPKPR